MNTTSSRHPALWSRSRFFLALAGAAPAGLLLACASTAVTAPGAETSSASASSEDSRARAACEAETVGLTRDAANVEAVALVLDAATGRLLGMAGQRGAESAPRLAAEHAIGPGSVMKTFTFAAAIERGVLHPADRWEGGSKDGLRYQGEKITDNEVHAPMTTADVLAFSSNVGTLQIFERVGEAPMKDTWAALHLPVDALHPGLAAIGVDVAVPPLTVAAAFRAVTVDGVYRGPSGESDCAAGATCPRPILTSETVRALRGYLRDTVSRPDGTGHAADLPGVAVAGKTGTWSGPDSSLRYGDFVGVVPAEAPRFVILVGVLTKNADYSGGTVAAPAFARIAKKLLAPS